MVADYIKLRPDRIGWTLLIYTENRVHEFTVGDVIQFTEETERTLGRWLADGPADFHNATAHATHTFKGRLDRDCEICGKPDRARIHRGPVPTEIDGWPADPDLVRDLERGK